MWFSRDANLFRRDLIVTSLVPLVTARGVHVLEARRAPAKLIWSNYLSFILMYKNLIISKKNVLQVKFIRGKMTFHRSLSFKTLWKIHSILMTSRILTSQILTSWDRRHNFSMYKNDDVKTIWWRQNNWWRMIKFQLDDVLKNIFMTSWSLRHNSYH